MSTLGSRGRYNEDTGFMSVKDKANTLVVFPGDNLAAKYAELCTAGNMGTLSATNRRLLLLMPGTYTLTSTLTLDTNYVDVAGTGAPDNTIICGNISYATLVPSRMSVIYQTANDIRLARLKVLTTATENYSCAYSVNASNNAASIVQDCIFDMTNNVDYQKTIYSSRFENDNYGTFRRCVTGVYGWRLAAGKNLGGLFEDCYSGDKSFGGDGDSTGNGMLTGTFRRCYSGAWSYGGGGIYGLKCGPTALFEYCIAGDNSYAMGKEFAATARWCKGGVNCFAGYMYSESAQYYSAFTGRAEFCITDGGNSFGMGHASCAQSGVIINCLNGNKESDITTASASTVTDNGTRATVTTNTGVANTDIKWTAKHKGSHGNNITIEYVTSGGGATAWRFIGLSNKYGVHITAVRPSVTNKTAAKLLEALAANTTISALVTAENAEGSDGSGTVPAMSEISLSGGVDSVYFSGNCPQRPLACAANTSVYAFDNGATYTNAGATGSVTFTLPAAIPGLKYTFKKVVAGQNVVISKAGSDTLDGASTLTNSTEEVAYITVECVTAGAWISTINPKSGTWASA